MRVYDHGAMRPTPNERAIVLGAGGGVAWATLALLATHAVTLPLRERLRELVLVERDPNAAAALTGGAFMPEGARDDTTPIAALRARGIHVRVVAGRSIDGRADLEALLDEFPSATVVDLAGLGSYDAITICDARGCRYLNACFDHWPGAEGPADPADRRVMIAARSLHPSRRPLDLRHGHVVGAGMNPGLVNALANRAIPELARLVACPLDTTARDHDSRSALVRALALHALYVTEEDTSTWSSPSTDEFACSWHPRHCLEELLEDETMITQHGEVVGLGHRPVDANYEVRVADEIVAGYVVPHDEVVSLGYAWPGLEMAYVYRPAPGSRAALAAHPDRAAAQWPIRRLYPPYDAVQSGRDTVGVLLCSRTFGELWLGFDNDVTHAAACGSNPTQLQVAAGVLAAWLALPDTPPGTWVVEDLDTSRVLTAAEAILGPTRMVWDREAPPRSLGSRRVLR